MKNTLGDLHSWKPKILHLHVFGCRAYVYLPNEVYTNKLTLCSELIIFIGYEDNGYRFICHTQENVIFCSIQVIFDEGHFPRCLFSYPKKRRSFSRLIPEIKSLVSGPFGIDKPALTFSLPTPIYPRPLTSLILSNLPTHSKSLSLSPSLTPPKCFSVKIEEVQDVEDEDIEIHSSSPSFPEASLS